MILTVALGDLEGRRRGFIINPIFPIDTDRGGVEMHRASGYPVSLERLHGQLGKDPLRSGLKKKVQDPTHRIIVEYARWNTLTQQQLSVPAFKELFEPIERGSPGERVQQKSQHDDARFDRHLGWDQTVDCLHQSQSLGKGFDDQKLVHTLSIDIRGSRINQMPGCAGPIEIEVVGIRTHPASDTTLNLFCPENLRLEKLPHWLHGMVRNVSSMLPLKRVSLMRS